MSQRGRAGEGRFVVNVIRTDLGVIVAVADSELLGKRVESGDGAVLYVNKEFYGEREVGEDDVINAISAADMVVLTGRRAVELGVRLGLVAPGSEIVIGGVPHVQVFRSLVL